MIQIKALKSGPYSFSHATGPVVILKEGELLVVEDDQANMLARDGWAEKIGTVDEDEEVEEEETGKTDSDLRKQLINKLNALSDDAGRKAYLQKYAKEKLGIKLSKAKPIKEMLNKICGS